MKEAPSDEYCLQTNYQRFISGYYRDNETHRYQGLGVPCPIGHGALSPHMRVVMINCRSNNRLANFYALQNLIYQT